MAYAAYSEFLGASLPAPAAPRHPRVFVVMSITVPSMEAYHLRRVLADCTDTGLLRCIPQPQESLVQMQVRLSADRVDEVMHQVMACMSSGQIGCISSWAEHLARQGAPHGL